MTTVAVSLVAVTLPDLLAYRTERGEVRERGSGTLRRRRQRAHYVDLSSSAILSP